MPEAPFENSGPGLAPAGDGWFVVNEIVELAEWDGIRIDRDTMRAVEAGPEGVEYLAFGAGDDPADAELVQDWWSE